MESTAFCGRKDGKLGYVQPIGADPKKVTRNMTEVYGPGAFLLAGTEMYRMAEDAPKQNALSRRTVFRKLQLCFPIDRRG